MYIMKQYIYIGEPQNCATVLKYILVRVPTHSAYSCVFDASKRDDQFWMQNQNLVLCELYKVDVWPTGQHHEMCGKAWHFIYTKWTCGHPPEVGGFEIKRSE